MSSRFEQAIARLDDAHRGDPRTIEVNGQPVAYELHYAHLMSCWLVRLEPDASEALRLAVRAQHLCRWQTPRQNFPMDRAGYKAWRSECAKMHAQMAGQILAEVGYEPEVVDRVQRLVRKEKLKVDTESQTLEDVACLVFLEDYFADFAAQHDPDKVVDIVRRTWIKMSPGGHQAALALNIPEGARQLVERALQPS